MASTTFVDNSSIIYASWLNDVNNAVYNGTFASSTISPTNIVCNGSVSGTAFSGLVNNTLTAPGAIGNGTPNTGAFTTLTLTNALGRAYGGTGLATAGTAGNVLTSDGTNWTSSSRITQMTAQVSTSGTSISFTGIPAWAKKITVIFIGVSTNGTSVPIIQLGSGSPVTTGYLGSASSQLTTSVSAANYTTGFGTAADNAATYVRYGNAIISNITGNTWVASGTFGYSDSARSSWFGGASSNLSGSLDRVVITTVNGTDTFDGGVINVLYE